MRASSMNIWRVLAFSARCGRSVLITTWRSIAAARSRARKISPMPPTARRFTSSYLPNFAPTASNRRILRRRDGEIDEGLAEARRRAGDHHLRGRRADAVDEPAPIVGAHRRQPAAEILL